MIGIYKITSPSGKIYIGQSVNIEKRIRHYKNKGCLSQPKLQRSFNKYGFEEHNFEVVCKCNIKELNDKERYYQDLYLVLENGLNCLLTKSNNSKGVVSEETKNKIRIANIGKKATGETKLKMSNARKGIIFSIKHKNNLSISQKGVKKRNTNNMGKGNLGKPAHNRIIVLDTSFGVFYESVKEAAELNGIDKSTLISYLKNRKQNKTNLIYC